MKVNPETIRLQAKLTDVLLSKDVWNASELRLRVNLHRKDKILSFQNIHQQWLKQFVKKFIMYAAINKEFRTLQNYISSLNSFSKFLSESYSSITITKINRNVIIDHLNYLNNQAISSDVKRNKLCHLNIFFKIGLTNQWFDVSPYLIRPEDRPKQTKVLPRYIPEEVLQQLNGT